MVLILFPFCALLAENAFINTGLHALVNLQPDRTRITWLWAYTVWPGEVFVTNLCVRAQDRNTQWILEADRASGVIDLLALREFRFSAHHLRGSGASFRMRMLAESAPVSEEALTTPPIEGLANPQVPSLEALYGAAGRFVHVQLDDLEVEHVRELWVENYHFTGDAHVSGGLDLLHKSWLEVKDVVIEIERGDLRLGAAPIVDSMHGRINLAMSGRNPDTYSPPELLAFVTARIAVEAQVQDLRFLSFYLRKAPWLRVSGGKGPIDIDIAIEEGRILDGSRLGVNATSLVVRFFSYAVTGDGNVRFGVTKETGQSTGRLSLDFLDYAITKWGDEAPHLRGKALALSAITEDLGLAQPFETLDVVVALPDAVIPDVAVYNAYLPRDLGIRLTGGTGTMRGDFQASTVDNIATGDLRVDGAAVRARIDELSLSGDVSLRAHLVEGRLDEGQFNLSGSRLDLGKVRVVGDAAHSRGGQDDSHGWWAEIRLPRATLTADAPLFLDAKLAVKFRDTVPLVTIFSHANPLPGFVRGLLKVEGMSGTAHLLLGEDTLVLPAFVLRGGPVEVRMNLRRRRSAVNGNLYARYGILSFGVRLSDTTSKVHLFDARTWFAAQPLP